MPDHSGTKEVVGVQLIEAPVTTTTQAPVAATSDTTAAPTADFEKAARQIVKQELKSLLDIALDKLPPGSSVAQQNEVLAGAALQWVSAE